MAEEESKVIKKSYSKEKIAVTIMLVGVTAAVFLAIGYWAGRQTIMLEEDKSATSTTTDITTIPEVPAATTSATDETADWKTYTNEEYGFSFKYPGDLIKTNSKQSSIISLNKSSDPNNKKDFILVTAMNSSLTPEAYANNLTVGDVLEGNEITINGNTAYEETRQHMKEVHRNVYFSKRGNIIQLTLLVAGGSDSSNDDDFDESRYLPIFTQILSTFQFTK
jgi:hypothetical protein